MKPPPRPLKKAKNGQTPAASAATLPGKKMSRNMYASYLIKRTSGWGKALLS